MDDAKYSITDLGEAFLESYKAYREGTEVRYKFSIGNEA
jgi:predicted transcriptional regulator